ncbi:TadA family conjugal transfer-associated ATPase [Kribbella sp. NPDC048915]|uniref:TadA family conjugal transfer-associated ATPase n=1 Tax=Kribbella sp. NPDC048915 TaxID=3155148 RepID=UPI0033E222C4
MTTTAVPADLLDRVRSTLALTGVEPSPAHVAAALRADGTVCGDSMVLAVVTALRREALGAGPLDSLLAEPGVTDILVNGPDEVYIDRGHGLEFVAIRTGDESAIRRLATRLAAAAGRRLDDSTPYVDARLADGTRFHAVLAPIAAPGTCLSLRVPSRKVFTLDDLVTAGALPPAGVAILHDLLESRLAFLISGGTGTGKTTLLNSLLSLVNPAERIVLVEDANELRPDHPHVVRLEARPPNIEGSGEISLRDLVRQALRMRPDRLVVGEVRGAEVVDLLTALNTGHEGGCGTIHANSAADVPARLEALGALAGLTPTAVHSQAASAVHAVIHLTRTPAGHRRIAEIHTLTKPSNAPLTTHPAVTFHPDNTQTLHPTAGIFTKPHAPTTHPTTTAPTTTRLAPAAPTPTTRLSPAVPPTAPAGAA